MIRPLFLVDVPERDFDELLRGDRLSQVASMTTRDQIDRDIALMTQVEDLLVPRLGAWEGNERVWWHNLDYNGDGIRQLIFRADVFPYALVPDLQMLLCGPHEHFCILCELYEDLEPDGFERFGRIAIFAGRVMVAGHALQALREHG